MTTGKVSAANPFNEANDYGDISGDEHFKGRFIRVPTKIAKGLTAVEPQKALEDWSNAHNVFQFIRVEDTAYDPNVGEGENPVMYFTDTGSSGAVPNTETGRLMGGGVGPYGRGRIFRMEFARTIRRRSSTSRSSWTGTHPPTRSRRPCATRTTWGSARTA